MPAICAGTVNGAELWMRIILTGAVDAHALKVLTYDNTQIECMWSALFSNSLVM
jgi:hypothetical protein